MKKSWETLKKKYPKIIKCGFECDLGWYDLIDYVCFFLQFDIEKNNYPSLEFIQIKEKFGTLRMYHKGANERQYGVINFAEFLSQAICELCGDKGKLCSKMWAKTLCESCEKKLMK